MSQNQWNCTPNSQWWEERGLDCSAECRMKGHVRVISDLLPDVLGGQEVNMEMQKHLLWGLLESKLPYTQIYGNYTPIIYRADKLELLDTEYILYPEYGYDYEGKFNDSRSKSCNLGVFRVKEDGKVFVFATTHLWWKDGKNAENKHYQEGSDQVRAVQMKMACDFIDRYREKYNCPAFLVGDMNATYDSDAIAYALGEGGFSHAHNVAVEYAHNGIGYHSCSQNGYGPWRDNPFEAAIDHILVKGAAEGTVKRFDRYTPEYYLLLSDHAPVFVDVEL